MGGPDPARGEHIIIARAQGVQRLANGLRVVGHHPRLHQRDAAVRQPASEIMHIGVARAPRQELIANRQYRCGLLITHRASMGFAGMPI